MPTPVAAPLGWTAGLRAFAGGIGFVLGTPAVWPWALVPVLVMLLLASAFGALGIWGVAWAGDALLADHTETWATGLRWLAKVAAGLVSLLLALLLALVLAQPLSGFALDRVAQAQARALLGRPWPEPALLASLVRSLKVAVVTLGVAVPVIGGLFAVSLVFPPAAVVTVPVKFLVGAWLLAWDFLDYPLALRGLGVRARLRWVTARFGAFTLFGLAWAAVLVVPCVGLGVLPLGVAGAARLVAEDEQ